MTFLGKADSRMTELFLNGQAEFFSLKQGVAARFFASDAAHMHCAATLSQFSLPSKEWSMSFWGHKASNSMHHFISLLSCEKQAWKTHRILFSHCQVIKKMSHLKPAWASQFNGKKCNRHRLLQWWFVLSWALLCNILMFCKMQKKCEGGHTFLKCPPRQFGTKLLHSAGGLLLVVFTDKSDRQKMLTLCQMLAWEFSGASLFFGHWTQLHKQSDEEVFACDMTFLFLLAFGKQHCWNPHHCAFCKRVFLLWSKSGFTQVEAQEVFAGTRQCPHPTSGR